MEIKKTKENPISIIESFSVLENIIYNLSNDLNTTNFDSIFHFILKIIKNAFASKNPKFLKFNLEKSALGQKLLKFENAVKILQNLGFDRNKNIFKINSEVVEKNYDLAEYAFNYIRQLSKVSSVKIKKHFSLAEREITLWTKKEKSENKAKDSSAESVDEDEDEGLLRRAYVEQRKRNEKLYPKKFTLKHQWSETTFYDKLLIRISFRFHKKTFLDLYFSPEENISCLFEVMDKFVIKASFKSSFDYDLVIMGRGKVLQRQKTFANLNLVPSTKMCFVPQLKDGAAKLDFDAVQPESIFKEELLNCIDTKPELEIPSPKQPQDESKATAARDAEEDTVERLVDKFFSK